MGEIDIDARLRPFLDEPDLAKKASFFTSLRTFEDGFDRAQGLLRTIASAWLLVSLAALGTVIANDAACLADLTEAAGAGGAETSGAPPPEGCNYPLGSLARTLILLAAALGITALWYLDQRVYQSLLHSVFALGARLEQLDHKLPPVRLIMQCLNGDVTRRLSWFYQAPFVTLLLLQLANLVAYVGLLHEPARRRFGEAVADWELFLILVLTAGALIVQGMILNFARRWPSLARLSGNLDALRFKAPVLRPHRRPAAASRHVGPLRQPPVSRREPASRTS